MPATASARRSEPSGVTFVNSFSHYGRRYDMKMGSLIATAQHNKNLVMISSNPFSFVLLPRQGERFLREIFILFF